MSRKRSFADSVKTQQIEWARSHGLGDFLEMRNKDQSWVLRRDATYKNLFKPDWWSYIEKKEHKWARALNSSQCFAINLFGPLKDNTGCARKTLQKLMPERAIKDEDQVIADFEFTPAEAPKWLGEKEQPTQIDVYFEVKRQAECIGHVLIEVKYSERSFGACRGWTKKVPKGKHDLDPMKFNQDRTRCLNIAAVINSPNTQCWLAEQKGRNYWELIKSPSSSIRLDKIQQASGCPFRYGLYQMMRNRVLADELMRHTGAEWAEFVVCRHPKNDKVIEMDDAYLSRNALTAFRSFSNPNSVLEWNPIDILRAIASTSDSLQDWELWMSDRYFN